MSNLSSTKWHVPPHAELLWRVWGDEVVVFHPPSGDTHILHPLAGEVLRYLSRQAADLQEVAGFVASREVVGEDAADDVSRELLSKLLADFDQLGLIEPAHEDP